MILCLDPGHGGHDSGAVGPGGIREKDAVLAIAQRIASHLAAIAPAINVRHTRTTDVFLTLAERATFANHIKADLFLSIHLNSAERPTAQGTETFVAPNPKPATLAWGTALQDAMTGHLKLNDRGLKSARFAVLTATRMPAALIEPWFMHNEMGARLAGDSDVLDELASRLAKAIATHTGQYAPLPLPIEDIDLAEPPTHHTPILQSQIAQHAQAIIDLLKKSDT